EILVPAAPSTNVRMDVARSCGRASTDGGSPGRPARWGPAWPRSSGAGTDQREPFALLKARVATGGGGGSNMPKTTRAGRVNKSELPSTIRKSPPKAQRTFAKLHDAAAKQYGQGERAH